MISLLEVIRRSAEFLAARGVGNARLDAEILIGHALGLRRMQLYLQFERFLTEAELAAIRPLVRRRGQREPLQYVTGEVEFDGLRLRVDRRALIPRPETEYLVELVAARLAAAPDRIVDLGTGSGALALALAARYPEARVTGVDRSAAALELASENSAALGVDGRLTWVLSDWFANVEPGPGFGLIVANPPYLSAGETAAAEPEVREFEPADALTAGEGGQADLRTIVREARGRVAPGGILALETGIGHHRDLTDWAARTGWARTESLPDLTGRDRFLFAYAGA